MSTDFQSLAVKEKLSPSLTIRQHDELDILVINHPQLTAAITLQGAQLVDWQPVNQQPVIWLSDNAFYKKGKAIRGGIPICWPWFGKVAEPAHGFARILPWQLTAHSEDDSGVVLAFTLTDNEYTQQYWPHKFTLIARYKLGNECNIELESFGDFQATAALHSYFAIGNIQDTTISGLGLHYHDKVTDRIVTAEQPTLTLTDETDRVYTHARTQNIITDQNNHRTIAITHYNQSDVVVWNPFKLKSSAMSDMTSDGYQTMICIETARISKPLQVTEKGSVTFGVTIEVKQD